MTEEEIALENARVKRAMCYELMELCLTADPARLFGTDTFHKPGELEEVFRYIDNVFAGSDDAAFYAFYQKAMQAAREARSEESDPAPQPDQKTKYAELKTLCGLAYQQLTPEQQELFLGIDFDDFRAEVENRQKDGSLLPDNILGFLLHTINTFSKKR